MNQRLENGEHRIDSHQFRNVKRFARDKGYRSRGKIEGRGIKYDHCSIHGLSIYVNEEAKTITAESLSQSVLSSVGDEFDFPLY